MATVIARPTLPPIELPEPSHLDDEPLGIRIGKPFHFTFLRRFGVSTQLGTIWLGTWGVMSVLCFLGGLGLVIAGDIDQVHGNIVNLFRYFANIQQLPPDGLSIPRSLNAGGYWCGIMAFWAGSVIFWTVRCYERLMRFKWRPFLVLAWYSAIVLAATIWVWRPLAMGTWAEAPAFGLNGDLDWAENFSVLWGNLYYDPWHMLSIFFLFGSTMLWGMHGATVLATAAEGSYMEDAEIKDMHSGSYKMMLFWRWTMGWNANPKTIHDWLLWFSMGVVLAGALGIITTGTVTKNWYVWAVDHGWVQTYGPISRDAINLRPRPFGDAPPSDSLQDALYEARPIDLSGVHFETASARIQPGSEQVLANIAAVLAANPDVKVAIEGYTDDTGNETANVALSKARAESVKSVLVSQYHIAAGRISTAGFGSQFPIASNDTDAGRAKNRRVDLVRVGS
jgi:photosynthetic reaction center M subunit